MNELFIPSDKEDVAIRLADDLPIEYYSPFIDASEIMIGNARKNPRGAYNISENVQLPASAIKALKSPQILSKRNRLFKIPGAKLRSDGRLIDAGDVEVLKYKQNLDNGNVFANLSILFNNSDFLEAIGEKTLHDLSLGGNILIPKNPDNESLAPWENYNSNTIFDMVYYDAPGPEWWNIQYSHKAVSSTNWWAKEVVLNGHDYVCFPSFKAKRNDDDVTICNWWDYANQKFYDFSNEFIPIDVGYFGGNIDAIASRKSFRNPIIPCYYYHQVLRHCFSDFGFFLEKDELLDDTFFKKLYLHNNRSIVKESILYLSGYTEGIQPIFPTGGINASNIFMIQEDTTIEPKNHLTDFSIKEFLQDFCLNFGCRFVISGDRKVKIEHLELEQVAKSYDKYGPEPEIVSTRFDGFEYKYNLTADSSLEMIDEFTIKLNSLRETPNQPFAPTLPANEYGLDQSLNTVENNATSKYLNNLIPYTAGNASKSYEIMIPPLACSKFDYPRFTMVDIPNNTYGTVNNPANSWMPFIDAPLIENEPDFYNRSFSGFEYYPNPADPSGPELFGKAVIGFISFVPGLVGEGTPINLKGIYHGLVASTGWIPHVYPYASNHNFKPGDNSPLGWFHLGLIGSEGIVDTFIKEMMDVWLSKEYHVFQLPLNWNDIIAKKWNQCEIIRGVKYYVAKYKFSTPINGLVETECYPIL